MPDRWVNDYVGLPAPYAVGQQLPAGSNLVFPISPRGFIALSTGFVSGETLDGSVVTNLPVIAGNEYRIRMRYVALTTTADLWILR